MYADRHARSPRLDPRSLGIAVALNGAALGALLLARPDIIRTPPKPPLIIRFIPVDPPPKPLPPEPAKPHPVQRQLPVAPKPPVDLHLGKTDQIIDVLPPILPPIGNGGPFVGPTETPTPTPALVAPEVDPAHRGDLQPTYPASELRAEREGKVVVRVLIGTDGRVRQVERVSATSDAFLRATEERALTKWRFRPATRGGVPVEAWRTMSIAFVIPR